MGSTASTLRSITNNIYNYAISNNSSNNDTTIHGVGSSFLPTKQRQELLIFGYVRMNSTNINIPIVLIHLFLVFYNHNIYMIFQGKRLTKFLSMDNHKAL